MTASSQVIYVLLKQVARDAQGLLFRGGPWRRRPIGGSITRITVVTASFMNLAYRPLIFDLYNVVL